jgi:hypothetical protein
VISIRICLEILSSQSEWQNLVRSEWRGCRSRLNQFVSEFERFCLLQVSEDVLDHLLVLLAWIPAIARANANCIQNIQSSSEGEVYHELEFFGTFSVLFGQLFLLIFLIFITP